MTGQPERPSFDRAAFIGTLDATRQARGLSWRQAATQADVSPSTFTRLGDGHAPDVDTFAALVVWMHAAADQFIIRPRPVEEPEPFPVVLARAVRATGLPPRDAAALQQVALTAYGAFRESAE